MGWKTYAFAMLLFNLLGLFVVYALQRFRGCYRSIPRTWEP
jgi:K+-transporting ATPase A subunit